LENLFWTNALAAIAVAASLVHYLLVSILDEHFGGALRVRAPGGQLSLAALHVPMKSSCAVAAIWVALALSGRWRAEKSWIDRTGRLLGWYWIMYPVVNKTCALL
jgi:hypothetical protein